MARRLNAATFILVVSGATFCGADYYRGGRSVNHNYDFTKLFEQNKTVWTYFSSWNDTYTCKREVMKNRRGNTLELQIFYTENNRTHNYTVNGTLSNVQAKGSPLNAIYMKDNTGDRLNKELIFATNDYSCAVVYIESFYGPQHVTFDLLVKESRVRKGPRRACIRRYNKQVKGRVFHQANRTLYSSECSSQLKAP
uniref:Putative lipocalin n=1 Tax=Rhipicephalus microplus TaxID=6941 RepID=A0A6G5A4C4_RHIMP